MSALKELLAAISMRFVQTLPRHTVVLVKPDTKETELSMYTIQSDAF